MSDAPSEPTRPASQYISATQPLQYTNPTDPTPPKKRGGAGMVVLAAAVAAIVGVVAVHFPNLFPLLSGRDHARNRRYFFGSLGRGSGSRTSRRTPPARPGQAPAIWA